MYDYRYESITQVYDLTILSNFFSLGFFFLGWIQICILLISFHNANCHIDLEFDRYTCTWIDILILYS